MVKYTKKAKTNFEVTLMEVPHQAPLGVRTRARTLALERLQSPPAPAIDDASYLQLRNRRLEKTPGPKVTPYNEEIPNPIPSPYTSSRSSHNMTGSVAGSMSIRSCCSKREEAAASPEMDLGVEVSFGENFLDLESRGRNARETTPCSLIQDSETIGTPGSTTRPTNSATTPRRVLRNMPTAQELEEFFSKAEQLQLRMFTEKYNFDFAKGRPLPGPYQWVKVDH